MSEEQDLRIKVEWGTEKVHMTAFLSGQLEKRVGEPLELLEFPRNEVPDGERVSDYALEKASQHYGVPVEEIELTTHLR